MDITPQDRIRIAAEVRCSVSTVDQWCRGGSMGSATRYSLAAACSHLGIDTGLPPWPRKGWRGLDGGGSGSADAGVAVSGSADAGVAVSGGAA